MCMINCNNGKVLSHFYGHFGDINDCQFSPDGKTIVSISEDKTLRTWKPITG